MKKNPLPPGTDRAGDPLEKRRLKQEGRRLKASLKEELKERLKEEFKRADELQLLAQLERSDWPEARRERMREQLRRRLGCGGEWYPPSYGQEALWFLWQLAPESWTYNLVVPVGVRGRLDVAALEGALAALSDRHPPLRTQFRSRGGELRQRALRREVLAVERVDASEWSEERLRAALAERSRRPFDLEASAAPRVTVFRRGPEHHVLLIVLHHIVADLWSIVVMMDELRHLYAAARRGSEPALPPLPVRYEDWVRWQRRELEGEQGEESWQYWRRELAGELPVLGLPTDRPRPPVQSFRGGTVVRRLDAELSERLGELARREGATLFMTLACCFQVLLHRYSGQESLLIGYPSSGRGRAEVAGLIGDFVNMVPLRAELAGRPTFRALLARARQRVVAAMPHADYPFSLLVDRLRLARDVSRPALFQATLVLQKLQRYEELSSFLLPGPDAPRIPFADLWLEPIPLEQQEGQFDVNLEMKVDEGGRLVGAWKYAADLFDAGTIERMAASFETLARGVVADPERAVADLPLLDAAASGAALTQGRGERVELPSARSVYELFEEQARRAGEAVAVSCGGDGLTYAQLDRRVSRLAGGLAKLGVGADVLVALLLPRGVELVAAMLAVSKAGGAFLPLDPRHPHARTREIVERSGARLVVATERLRRALEGEAEAQGAPLPEIASVAELASAGPAPELPAVRRRDLAYVMYTSGSTGRPKGVMVEHEGMVNHVLAKLSDLGMGEEDALAQNGPQSFDIVVWQCLAPLAAGGRVVVLADEVAEDPAALLAAVAEQGVTVLQVVPSMLRAVLEEVASRQGPPPPLPGLRWMVPTGEALPAELCRRWLALYPRIPVLNTYGSTECSDDQCHYELRAFAPADAAAAIVSVGAPIQNISAHVLDTNLAPVPAGVVGELYIGGIGVGRGYLGDPSRTAASFLPDPFSERPGARLYRTRDHVRRRPDGNLDFLGRVDGMIKLRGFRIEPGEVESALCRHPAVAAAAVVALAHPGGDKRLVAYFVPAPAAPEPTGEDGLRRFLEENLPRYMVPTTLHRLERLPLTANGKLDRARLPAPDWRQAGSVEFVAPRTAAEERMAAIWREVLNLERVGVTDDFFAIGGDSISSIGIVARCRRAGLELRPSDLFLHPTVAALSALAAAGAPPAEPDGGPPVDVLAVSRDHLEAAVGQVEFDDE